jgi:hypothetical protein
MTCPTHRTVLIVQGIGPHTISSRRVSELRINAISKVLGVPNLSILYTKHLDHYRSRRYGNGLSRYRSD